MRLGPIVDIGFAQSGDLYIGEKSVTNDYVLLTVRKDGGVEKIVGRRGVRGFCQGRWCRRRWCVSYDAAACCCAMPTAEAHTEPWRM